MSAPTQFRKKPVVISAIQWTGENLVDVIHFTDGRPPNNKSSHAGMMWDQYVDVVRKDGLKIFTMEGKMDASIGDWIIKGVKGEHYPCKPEIFALTYDDASASTDLSQAAVAAALSAAASELDGELSEESTALLGAWAVEWAKQATSVQDHIRALITPDQHYALAAHVAAEVAKARAVKPLVWVPTKALRKHLVEGETVIEMTTKGAFLYTLVKNYQIGMSWSAYRGRNSPIKNGTCVSLDQAKAAAQDDIAARIQSAQIGAKP